ncbi:RNA pseudouridine synthase [Rhodocytophaga rosea]|uniref:RNA pseudouridine synthase n=1 Tax=Rhodocytophaga rosea TaxID=2704465 RepID=A0A6C0GF64_9BACT|nr:pseudouridine synthase [Rhodocytophaga rosea]QHT66588.1 RNA pseudouridine synthase [Rhodocytophaga rosea]
MPPIQFEDLIIFENDDYILINKPPHISSLDERSGEANNILRMARLYHPDIQIAHRLDKETSGILALAKHPEAYRSLAIQFEKRQVNKIYHAVVSGIHTFENQRVFLSILPLTNGTVKIDRQKGKEAETYFTTLKLYQKHSLIECKPVTGRMHQIRIHLSTLKAPIVCDPQYGGEYIYLSSIKKKFNLKKDTEEQPLIQRVALHARSLSFTLLNGEELSFEAPYPKDFDVLIKQLEKNL